MERVLVIGCPGAGKSTFARALQGATGLTLYYLDQLFHLPDGSHVSQADFDEGLAAILKAPRWIIDGNYQRTLAPRLARCDTVFLLDYPLSVCLAGAAARIGKARPDMPWIERTFDPAFRQWILDFPTAQRPQLYAQLAQYKENKQHIIFHSREESTIWLENWAKAQKGVVKIFPATSGASHWPQSC